MCGISGIASSGAVSLDRRDWLRGSLDAIRHRGPDDWGDWWSEDGCVGLGHRRLSIVDLSAAGHQPMQDCRGECHIVFNGEIYNFADLRRELIGKGHTFRSHSDTEVILAAYREWGTGCLSRLNGMFAFALYDSRNRKLLLARDRAGEKPLFYAFVDGAIRFASELKALLADPRISRRVNRQSLDCYLTMGYVPGNRCILEGMNKLAPAHAMLFDLNTRQSSVWRYWELPVFDESNTVEEIDVSELVDELEVLLEDSVRRQLVADVPVGILLSGGVDSSLITAMAVRSVANVRTFTISFPGNTKYDESAHARLIASHFHTEHTELSASDVSVDILPTLASQFDEPIVDSSMIPTYLVSRLVREHCKVALGGDGGDELFGGYGHHSRLMWMNANMARIPRVLRLAVAQAGGSLLPVGFKGRVWLQSLGEDLACGLPLIASLFDGKTRRKLMSKNEGWALVAEEIRKARVPKSGNLLQRVTRMDFLNYLPEDILVKVDRASMLNSLEIRAPLLDYRLIEFAFGKVPSHLKATATSRKVLLKKLAARLLPAAFDQHRKQGFAIPLGSWLQSGPWHAFFRDVLLGVDATVFDLKVLKNMLDGQGKWRENSERLFALVMFELWRRKYQISM